MNSKLLGKTEDLKYGIILDMDGVVIDSNPYHKIAWTNFLTRKNVMVNDRVFREVIFGTTGNEALIKLLNYEYSKKELENFNNEIDTEFRDIIYHLKTLEPVNGLLQFLQSISVRNYKIALATSAPPENVDLILNRLQLLKYFDLIIDNTRVVNGKPNPEIYLRAVQGLGISGENCIVFEDSFSGIISARDAGLLVIGVTTSHSENELINAGATICIKDFSEMSFKKIENLIRRV